MIPRGPGGKPPPWMACVSCPLVVSEFEFEALYEESSEQLKDSRHGQLTLDWSGGD